MTRMRSIALVGAVLLLAACNPGSKGGAQDTGYVADDTGMASPNAGYTPVVPPDSTAGVAKSSGTAGVAGVKGATDDAISAPEGKSPTP